MRQAATRLLEYLNAHGLAYGVLGSGRHDPDAVEHDLDLIVKRADVDEAGRLARRFCEDHSGRLIDAIRTGAGGRCFVLAWIGEPGPVTLLRLDLHAVIAYRGRPLLGADEVLATRRARLAPRPPSASFFVAAPGVEAVRTLIKVADHGTLTPRAETHLGDVWREAPEECRAEIARHWSPHVAALVARAVETRDFAEVRAGIPRPRRAGPASLPGRLLRAAVDGISRRFGRLVHPGGMVVAFLGIDGCGKSSVISGLSEALAPAFSRIRYHHFKPNLMGPPRRPPAGGMVFPTGPAPGFSMLSALRLVYYLFDYWIGYVCKVWPYRIRSALVLFDSYFHDLAVDPIRLQRRPLMGLARRLASVVPKPDLILVLDIPPEIARVRKPEGPVLEEAIRQRAAYLALGSAYPDACVLDGTKPVEELVREAARRVLDRMSARTLQGRK